MYTTLYSAQTGNMLYFPEDGLIIKTGNKTINY